MTTALATVDQGVSAIAFLQDDALFNRVERFATLMASGRATIPVELRNPGDCFAITLQAMQWKMNPISLAQKVFFIQGKIGYEAQAISAAINNHDSIEGRFEFEWFGPWEKILGKFAERDSKTKKDDNGYPVKYRVPDWKIEDEDGLGVKVRATFKGEAGPRELTLLMTQARTRNSTLWADDPKQQLAYLAQKRWARLHAPHIILGAYTPDELAQAGEIDMGAAEIVDTKPSAKPALPAYTVADLKADTDKLRKALKAGRSPDQCLAMIRTKFTVDLAMEKQIRELTPATDEPKADPERVTDAQVADMKALAEELGADIAAVAAHFDITSLDDLPAAKVSEAIEFIKEAA